MQGADLHLFLHAKDPERAKQSLEREGSRWEPLQLTLGTALLGAIVLCVGASPRQVPLLYLSLASIGLPWRAWTFYQKGWGFYLVDFCYFVNGAVIAHLVLGGSTKWQAVVYALSEGPLAAALIVWQCSWVLGSLSHTTSVLVHLLPGLSMYSIRHLGPACDSRAPGACPASGKSLAWPDDAMTWLLLVPTGLYLLWQLLYWFIVQVCCSGLIQSKDLDTSYRCLTRRHGRANSFLYRLARRGNLTWRLMVFGALQLVFTLVTLLVSMATYYSPSLAAAWQVVKFVVPLYHGAKHQANVPVLEVRKTAYKMASEGLASPVFLQLLDESGMYVAKGASAGDKGACKPTSPVSSSGFPYRLEEEKGKRKGATKRRGTPVNEL